MKAALLIVACVLWLAAPAAAKEVKVYIFVAPVGQVAGLSAGAAPAALQDSADDLRYAVRQRWLAVTTHRPDARLVVEVTRREAVEDEYRVHVHVTLDGREADLTGTSTRQWKIAAGQIAEQLRAWTKAAAQDDRIRVEAAAMRRRQQTAVDR